MRAPESNSLKKEDLLQEDVRKAHVYVATEVRDQPIQNFTCRELPLGRLQLFDISIDPIVIYRRFRDIAQDANDDYLLATQVEGTVLIKQGDIEFTQQPGSLTLMSAGEPYSVIHTQQSHRLILHIPNTVYGERILGNKKETQFRARLLPEGGLVTIVHSMLKSLAFEDDKLTNTEQYTLAESLLELASAIVRSDTDKEFEKQHTKQSALFRRTLEYLEANFMNSELTPEIVAKANGISMRYLHSLFQQSGISVSRWLWERRLKAAREDLIDPDMSHMRISEIAFRRGFNDPAHFSRTFRNRFDISPSGLRRQVAEDLKTKDA
ncbi:MAG: helix-turn-helix domain-containing protein [Gammaproteobacteria bacterium]|nr:helix-turn-helix domain-containing protein [Gammaproteobacteria bacterium]